MKRSIIFGLIVLMWFVVAFVPLSAQQVGQYDPWADINGDGKINMRDIGYLARLFSTEGNPTRDVNITNWPIDEEGNLRTVNEPKTKTVVVVENKTIYADPNPKLIGATEVDGYSKATVFVHIENGIDTYVNVAFMANNISYTVGTISIRSPTSQNGDNYAIWGPNMEFYVCENYDRYITVTIIVYLMT